MGNSLLICTEEQPELQALKLRKLSIRKDTPRKPTLGFDSPSRFQKKSDVRKLIILEEGSPSPVSDLTSCSGTESPISDKEIVALGSNYKDEKDNLDHVIKSIKSPIKVSGKTLYNATLQGDVDMVRTFLDGDNRIVSLTINMKHSFEQHTCLQTAARLGNMSIVKLLMDNSEIDLVAVDGDGHTAADIAEKAHHDKIAKTIRLAAALRSEVGSSAGTGATATASAVTSAAASASPQEYILEGMVISLSNENTPSDDDPTPLTQVSYSSVLTSSTTTGTGAGELGGAASKKKVKGKSIWSSIKKRLLPKKR